MLRFLFHKIINKKWMIASLLIGNVLLIAIVSSCALYENAIMQKMLTSNLAAYLREENAYPGLTVMNYSASRGRAFEQEDAERLASISTQAENYAKDVGLPESYFITHYFTQVTGVSQIQSGDGKESDKIQASLSAYSGIEDHITITAGTLYSGQLQENNTIEVIVPQRTMVDLNLMIGEIFHIEGIEDAGGNEYSVKITGVFEPTDSEDIYWYSSPANWLQTFVIPMEQFQQIVFAENGQRPSFNAQWASVVRYTDMKGRDAASVIEKIDRFTDSFDPGKIRANFYDIFTDYVAQASKLRVTLLVLQIPIFILLSAFIFMVSRQMLEMEENEIAIYKSRGASRKQILGLYLLQSVILTVLSLLLGIPLGYFICQAIGSANAFLDFVKRSALPITLTPQMWLYVLLAALVSIGAMVIPVFRHSDVTIVAHKQKKARANKTPLWQKLFLDLILLAIALYGYYLFNQNMEYLSQTMMKGSSLGPLLYLSSSVFILGASLLVLRIFPWVIRLIFLIGRRFWSPALYASFLRIMRTRGNQGFLMVFLIMTVSLGIFNAQAARTINENGEQRIRYSNGADLVVKEVWETDPATEVPIEPNISRYYNMEEIEEMTRVFRTKASVSTDGGTRKGVELMAVNTKEFGEIAWFKDNLLPIHWYNYLNAISQNAEAILMSENFETEYGIQIGDVVRFSDGQGNSSRGVVYGFVDYFPGYPPVEYVTGEDGLVTEEPNYLIVANLAQIQSEWGVLPYEIWMKVPGSTQFIYDFAEERGVRFSVFHDTKADLIKWKNDPVTQGTNGVLTVGFIVVLILCAIGFLIFWSLSIQSRVLQFGIFRAMGMSIREVFSMLGIEQLFISGVSIAAGTGIGRIASTLFVPMIQIAYSAAETVLPLELVSAAADYRKLFFSIGLLVVVCIGVLIAIISRIKISQALKLGED